MSGQITRVGIVLMVGFIAVFLQLNYVQIFAAEHIASRPANIRALIREYSIKRGDIVTVDFRRVAESKRTDGRLRYLRTYPGGELYGHITGYYSVRYGSDRIERTFNDQLLGESGVVSMQDIQDRLLGGGDEGDDVRLTIQSQLQQAARDALGAQRGAVVALDPSTGEVRTMWSNPSFDPSGLASHDPQDAKEYWESLDPGSRTSRLVNLATSRGYPPGSTFKVVTAAAALESGDYTSTSRFDDPVELDLPLTNQTLMNFTRSYCEDGVGIDLFDALRVSCDTTFGKLGLELHDEIGELASRFGFNEPLPFDVRTEPSTFPEIGDDEEPLRAYAGIGQGDVSATPLQMALVAAAIANGGELVRPRLVREVIEPTGGVLDRFEPESLGEVMDAGSAADLTDMMVAVVEAGTGTAAQIEGVSVAGKTGTAQTGVAGESPHAWFICFAPADDPELAVAVIVENGGTFGSEATGGAVAAPIAKRILEVDRALRGW